MFEHSLNNDTLIIKVSQYVSNDEWRINFGKYQNILNSFSPIYNLIIDFSDCIGIEPLAMFSIIICAKYYKSDSRNIRVYLPDISKKHHDTFLRFILREGFLALFSKIGTEIYMNCNPLIKYSKEIENKILEIQNITQNLEGVLLPATLLDVEEKTFNNDVHLNAFITDLINTINLSLYGFNDIQSNKIKNKLYQILHETIENVKFHAYEKQTPQKLVGIYVRIRKGLLDKRLSDEAKKTIRESCERESKYSQKLVDLSSNIDQFIEVFVIDSGIGMLGSILKNNCHEFDMQDNKTAFANIFYNTFYTGVRKTVKRHNTAFGGLYMLNRILSETNDFVYAGEGHSVIGVYSNTADGDINKYSHRFVQNDVINDDVVKGLSLIFRICVSNDEDQSKKISCDKKNIVVQELSSSLSNSKRERIKRSYSLDLKKGNIMDEVNEIDYTIKKDLFLLPPDNLSKDSVINFIDSFAMRYIIQSVLSNKQYRTIFNEKIESNKFLYNNIKNKKDADAEELTLYIIERQNLRSGCYNIVKDIIEEKSICFGMKNLYIIDIPSHEAIIYHLAITQVIKEKFFVSSELFEKIFIMTDAYDFYVLENDTNTFSLKCIDKYLDDYKFCIQWLRYHDSLAFWNYLFKEQSETGILYFLNANIHWGKDTINRYLNFENVLQNSILEQILEKALIRLQGVFGDKKVVFQATDTVVSTLTEKANITSLKNLNESINIKVNSVYVTGLTLKNHSQYPDYDDLDQNSFLVNIFAHPMVKVLGNNQYAELDSNNIKQVCLMLWPNDKWSEKFLPYVNEDYYRIGETHIVSKEENLRVVYRNTDNEYYCELDDAYVMFQTQYPKIVRIGHYHYKGNHELVNVNFNNIFDETSTIGSKVFNYVLCNVFLSLVNKTNYKQMVQKTAIQYQSILNEFIESNSNSLQEKNSIMVYPSHYYTDKIIAKIKAIIPKEIAYKIIPIVNMKHGNNISIISPDSIIRLRTVVKSIGAASGDVVFFDTIISSGRTRDVIKNYITSTEFKDLFRLINWRNIIIIDAYRRAYLDINPILNTFYLRMDVPRLGNENTCVLCKALTIADEIASKISNRGYSNVIQRWIESWKETSVLDISNKEYSIEHKINKSPSAFDFNPPIINSIGLLIYTIEAHMLFARDDIITDIINEYGDELTDQDIVLLICSKFLLFGDYRSTSLHISIVRNLINALIRLKNSNNKYLYLGIITLLIQKHDIVIEAIKQIVWYDVSNEELEKMCLDLKILFSHFSQQSQELFVKLPNSIVKIFDSTNRVETYQFLHNIVCNDCGHLHDTELMKYVKKSISSSKELFEVLPNICSILDSVMLKMQYIDSCEVNCTCDFQSSEMLQKELEDLKEQVKKLETNSDGKSFDEIWHSNEHILILQTIRRRKEYYEKIHSGMFISGDDNSVYNELYSIICDIKNSKIFNTDYICKIDKNEYIKPNVNQKIWYFWNKDIKTEVKYLLENIRNSITPFDNDFLANLYIMRDADYLEIKITNFSAEDATTVAKKAVSKRRQNMIKNKKLGVSINYTSEKKDDHYILNTIIKIPSLLSSLRINN